MIRDNITRWGLRSLGYTRDREFHGRTPDCRKRAADAYCQTLRAMGYAVNQIEQCDQDHYPYIVVYKRERLTA